MFALQTRELFMFPVAELPTGAGKLGLSCPAFALPESPEILVMGQDWYCKVVGQEVGPVTSEDLVSMLASGQIGAEDPVRAGTSGGWRPVKEVLAEAFRSSAGPEAAASADAEASWYCRMLGDEFGPYTFRELKNLAAEGQLSPKDEIREGRTGRWSLASTEQRLFQPRSKRRTPAGGLARRDDDLLSGLDDLEDAPEEEDLLEGFDGLIDVDEPAPAARPPQAKLAPGGTPPNGTPAAPAPRGYVRPAAPPAATPPVVAQRASPVQPPTAPEPPEPPKPQPEPVAAPSGPRDVMRELAASQIRAAQATAKPVARPTYSPSSGKSSGGGGMSFDLSSIDFTSKPFLIGGAVVAVLVLGYFGMSFGFLSGLSAGPVYDETVKLYEEFKTASAKGPESSEFTTFYGKYKPQHTALMQKIGSPSPGSTAHQTKQAVSYLGSRVESFKMKLAKDEQEMYKSSLEDVLGKLKTELGR